MKIKDLFEINKAITTSREYFDDNIGISCIHYGDIYRYYNEKTVLSSKILNKFTLDIDKNKILSQDSIIMPDVTETISDFGHLTYIKYDNIKYINGTHTLTILNNKNNNLKYLFYYLQSSKIRKQLQSLLLGSTVFQLSKKDLENFELKGIHNKDEQQHIVDIIGSLDNKIENNNKLLEKCYIFLNLNMKKLMIGKDKKIISSFDDIEIISSGIDKFNSGKIYLDTSCVSDNSIVDISNKVTYTDRPSRANMKPIKNSVWFAKLKSSPKHIIVKDYSNEILDNYIFSTGFLGIKIDNVKFNLLSTYFTSDVFEKEKDSLSIGATMQSINNVTFKGMYIPNFSPTDYISFNNLSEPILKLIYKTELENIKLRKLKNIYLAKFF